MLVVISSPTAVANEANIINALFDEGLEVLHLRKPEINLEEMRSLLEKIKPPYYHRVALHQHHELADDFGIDRLHYTEANRKSWDGDVREGKVMSTSIHDVAEYRTLSNRFNYTFFGPVFDSISKVGYTSSLSGDFVFPVEPGRPKVIAIGGVDSSNIQRAKEMKFDGVAALGTIWSKPENSISQFKALQKAWEQTGR